jgi:D-Tyr-tRNAtyr deacylase
MRAIIQRVTQAQVQIDGKLFSEIGNGLLILLGIEDGQELTYFNIQKYMTKHFIKNIVEA